MPERSDREGRGATGRERDAAPRRAPYRPPRLVRYGTILELTHGSFRPVGNLDGQVGVTKMGIAFLKSF